MGRGKPEHGGGRRRDDRRDERPARAEFRPAMATSPEGLTRRQERVGQRIREEVTERLREVDDRNLGFVTVVECVASPDLRHAKVAVSILGDEAKQAAGLVILARLLKRWRGDIGRSLGTRVIPELHVELDKRLERIDRVNQLIRDARASDPNPDPLSPEAAAALGLTAGTGLSPAVARMAAQAEAEGTVGRFLTEADFDEDETDDIDDDEDFFDDDEEDDDEEDDEDDDDYDEDDDIDDEDEDEDDDEEDDEEDRGRGNR